MSTTLRAPLKQVRTDINQLPLDPEKMDKAVFNSDKLLQIARVLQTTLVIPEIIELFAKEVKNYVRIDCVKYRFDKHRIAAKFGRSSRFTQCFELAINEQPLGQITFTRRIEFEKQEKQELNTLLNGLVYPIRNALLYQQALLDAHKDSLTGIKNRSAFNDAIKRETELAHRHRNSLSMIVLDIDHFKKINDSYGHYTGDRILKIVTQCTNKSIRGTDILFRYGGEEFVVLLPNTDDKGAYRLAQRIRRNIEKAECDYNGEIIKLTISAGIASLAEKDSSHDLFIKADTALYVAKANGRNLVRVSA